ncbi:glycosyltransferase family 1 protein [Flavobacterium commune]|uniref:Glycosyl transferase family 1 n=1 Tax=Flavobacterium commune TaxID=1306519 RepID=A0A1D9P898_9FLAO|nr:glycosyltransferase family 1 protein [Flavobacterium commune]AOZ98534.1 hypothetical protein BIW12_03295 [Flavobacterium commune]
MSKIKVLQVVTVMNRGGIETMLMNYFKGLDKNKFEFEFLVHRNSGEYEHEIIALGGKIHRLPALSYKSVFAYIRAIDVFFRENPNFDIVHVHNNTFGYFPLKYSKKYGIKKRIIHSHIAVMPEKSIKTIIGKYLKSKLPKYATDFFACGQLAGEWLYGNDLEFKIIPNAIDATKFRYNLEIINDDQEEGLNIINVARFSPQKNHFFLIAIFHELLTEVKNANLILVGNGELELQIKEKVNQLGLTDKVHFLGSRSDVNEILQKMDLFLMPSFFEGLPVSLVEAQAAGLPCLVSTGVPRESEIVKGNMTFLDLNDSKQKWVEAILKLSKIAKRDTFNDIVDAGFDIHSSVLWLQNYYENLVRNDT